jgi:hypothetical protein
MLSQASRRGSSLPLSSGSRPDVSPSGAGRDHELPAAFDERAEEWHRRAGIADACHYGETRVLKRILFELFDRDMTHPHELLLRGVSGGHRREQPPHAAGFTKAAAARVFVAGAVLIDEHDRQR